MKYVRLKYKDRKILDDSKRKLEEVHEVQTETQQTVDKVHQNQLEDQKEFRISRQWWKMYLSANL